MVELIFGKKIEVSFSNAALVTTDPTLELPRSRTWAAAVGNQRLTGMLRRELAQQNKISAGDRLVAV
jgi:hypothetical protein